MTLFCRDLVAALQPDARGPEAIWPISDLVHRNIEPPRLSGGGIIEKLNAAVAEALIDPAVRLRFAEFGFEIIRASSKRRRRSGPCKRPARRNGGRSSKNSESSPSEARRGTGSRLCENSIRLVVMPRGRGIFAFFCCPRDHRAQNSRCIYTMQSFARSSGFYGCRHRTRPNPAKSRPIRVLAGLLGGPPQRAGHRFDGRCTAAGEG
jgi:hypothetical protein